MMKAASVGHFKTHSLGLVVCIFSLGIFFSPTVLGGDRYFKPGGNLFFELQGTTLYLGHPSWNPTRFNLSESLKRYLDNKYGETSLISFYNIHWSSFDRSFASLLFSYVKDEKTHFQSGLFIFKLPDDMKEVEEWLGKSMYVALDAYENIP